MTAGLIIFTVCVVSAIGVAVLVVLSLTDRGDRASGDHHWPTFQAPETPDRVDVLVASFVPAPVASSPQAFQAGAGTSTRRHVIELHPIQEWAEAAWQRAGENARCRNWPMADRADFTESAWTKRSAAELATLLAREQTTAAFDRLTREVRNFGDYAMSGIAPRWSA